LKSVGLFDLISGCPGHPGMLKQKIAKVPLFST
jgi:hypothetical protein